MPTKTLQMTIDYINNYINTALAKIPVTHPCQLDKLTELEFPYFLEKFKANRENVTVIPTKEDLEYCVQCMSCNQREKLLLECPSVEAIEAVMKTDYELKHFSALNMGDALAQQVLLGSYYFHLNAFSSAKTHWRGLEWKLEQAQKNMQAYSANFSDNPAQETARYYQRLLTIVQVCLPLAEQKVQEETIEKKDIPSERLKITRARVNRQGFWRHRREQGLGDTAPLLPSTSSTYGSIV